MSSPEPASVTSSAPLPPITPAAGQTEQITAQQWKWSALAGMASYLDAGSIVALGSGLALLGLRFPGLEHAPSWMPQTLFGLPVKLTGILGAIGPNALGCAIGAYFGGWLGDKLGRKFIYQYDLMVYALGVLCITLAQNLAMLFIGTFVVGLAVGIDVPTSLALVGELAPARARGKLLGFTQTAWSLGPIIVYILAAALAPLESLNLPRWMTPLSIRIVFLHLFVVAIVTWALRRGLVESARWKTAKEASRKNSEARQKIRVSALFNGAHLRALVWTATIYLFWNLCAGTKGQFDPYILSKLQVGGQTVTVLLSSANFIMVLLVTIFVFMRYADHSFKTRKALWAIGAITQICAYAIFLVFKMNPVTALLNIALFGGGSALAGEAFYKVFSQELFPTMLRGTAQGFTFGLARTILAFWSFFVPMLATVGIKPLAAILCGFLVISGVTGYFFMPDTSGKTLEQIEAERA